MHFKKFEMLNAMQAKQPNAWQLVAALIDQKKWNEEVFCKHCGLDSNAFFKAQRGDPSCPTLNTLMAVCVGAETDMSAAEILLGAAGIKLSASIPLHRAYMYIIDHLAGEPLSVCNEFLKRLHFKELGCKKHHEKNDR